MSQNSHRIVTVSIAPADIIHSFIIIGERPVIVDTGMPGSASKVLKALAGEGFKPDDVSLILITHRHVDHIGSAAALKRITGAPVAVHPIDADGLRKGDGGPRPPTGLGGKFFDLTGVPGGLAEPCEPDIMVDANFSLEEYGVHNADVLHTPGHTDGSISVLFRNGEVIAGDLVVGGVSFLGGIARLGRARKPPFEQDPLQVRESLIRLLDLGATKFYVGHGGPLSAEAVRHYIETEPRLMG